MTRLKIAGFHFLISLIIVSSIISLSIFIWYPEVYARTDEFLGILWILVCVDITVGPLLTTVVFKPQKKGLKFDLTVIALLQILALSYGVNTLFVGRPVFIVFNIDRFTVVSAVDIPEKELKKASLDYQSFSYTGPVLVGAKLPDDPKKRDRMLSSSLIDNVDLAQLPEYYLPYTAVVDEVKNKLKSLDLLSKKSSSNQFIINKALQGLNLSVEQVGYLPMVVNAKDFIVLVNRKNAKILSYLALDGW